MDKKEFSMKNILKLIGIAALVAVIGFTVIACNNGTTSSTKKPGNTSEPPVLDTALNGTWTYTEDDVSLTYKMDNGAWEATTRIEDLTMKTKGTYTTSSNRITLNPTHIFGGGYFEDVLPEEKWYSEADIRNELRNAGLSTAEINEWMSELNFTSSTIPYSVSGNTLTLTMGGESVIFTKE
jgi:hypothetical protein